MKNKSMIMLELVIFSLCILVVHAQAVTFQAEDYTWFYDRTPGNSGGAYKNDDVDIEVAKDHGDGCNVGWIDQEEWLAYQNLQIPSTGNYTVRMRVSSPSGATASVDLNGGATVLGRAAIPNTGGWQKWQNVEFTTKIEAGTYNLGVYAVSGGWNFNWIEIIAADPEKLVWADEFNSIDNSSWSFETGGGGWGNNELQYYTNGQNATIQYDSTVDSNVLVLEARRENHNNYNCWYGLCTYTSTRLISRNKKSFQYGRIEARMKLPQTQGIWPAFWALGNNFDSVGWPQSGEIDIMEHVGFEPTLTHAAMHGPGYSGNTPIFGTYDLGENADANYHTYAIEWSSSEVRWYVDNNHFKTATRAEIEQYGQWVYDQPFWLLLNVAVGGNWPGSPDDTSTFPQRLYVDYVRVYQ